MFKTLMMTLALVLIASPAVATTEAPKAIAPEVKAASAQPEKPDLGPVPEYVVVKEKSSLKFIATQNGSPVEGEFKDFTANVFFDPAQLDKSSIKVEVQIASVSASYDEVVKNVKLPEWLSLEAFPKATFTSTKIVQMPSTDNFYAEGDLTIRGVKKPAVLNFQMQYVDAKRSIATGFATLKRSDFGVGQGQWKSSDVVKDIVRIEFRVMADKK